MISKDKQYRCKFGNEVRIYATDGGGQFPVHGAIKNSFGQWLARIWTEDGENTEYGPDFDLVEVKPRIKRTVWVNIFQNNIFAFKSKHDADESSAYRIACVKVEIDCEEGEGL